jgi:hypothetical protein
MLLKARWQALKVVPQTTYGQVKVRADIRGRATRVNQTQGSFHLEKGGLQAPSPRRAIHASLPSSKVSPAN